MYPLFCCKMHLKQSHHSVISQAHKTSHDALLDHVINKHTVCCWSSTHSFYLSTLWFINQTPAKFSNTSRLIPQQLLKSCQKSGPRHYLTRNNKCHEMFSHLTQKCQQRNCYIQYYNNVQNIAPLHGHKPRSPSPFINCLISNSQLCARPDLSQTLLRLFFQMFHELMQSGLLPSLVGNSFISFWVPQHLNSYIYWNMITFKQTHFYD